MSDKNETVDQRIEDLYETNKFGYKYLRYDRKADLGLVEEFKDKYNINTDCHNTCVNCQIHQITKYKRELEVKNQKSILEKGKELDKWFPVKCNFIKKGLPQSLYSKFELLKQKGVEERRAKRILFASIDPSAWAELMFGFDDKTKENEDMSKHWYLRWYQKAELRCTANRIVLRQGRRCVSGDSLVLMSNGHYKQIQDIKVDDQVISYNKDSDIFESKRVLNTFKNGLQDIYEIETSNFVKLRVTSNHPLLKVKNFDQKKYLKFEWSSLQDGLINCSRPRIVAIDKVNIFGTESYPDEAKLLGYMLTDGSLVKEQTPKFVSKDLIYIDEVRYLTNILFGYKGSQTFYDGAYRFHLTDGNKGTKNKVHDWAKKYKISGLKTSNKVIPKMIWDANRETISLFINRMFSGDGCVFVGQPRKGRSSQIELGLTSSSIKLLQDLKLLLLKFGITSTIKDEKTRNCSKLVISAANDIIKFFENIGFVYGKEKKSEEALELSKKLLESSTRTLRDSYNNKLLTPIKSCKYSGIEETYDIEVEDNHNFIIENIISHNSGKSAVSVLMLAEKIFNFKVFKGINIETGDDIMGGPSIAVITPFQSQVSAIFQELEKFILMNPELEKEVLGKGSKLYRQTPPLQMDFKNGATIKGFVTGSSSKEDGSGGGAIRGAIAADIVYLDEMDMVPESIYKKVIDPLKLSKPNVTFMGSSTPIGTKATFYKWCLQDPNFKEFYFPSTVLPLWEGVEEEAINESTQESFRSEYMADFITDSYGVFKNHLIISARRNYEYTMTHLPGFWERNFPEEDVSKFRICIGIDWNKKVGTEYSVTAWSPVSGDFWVLENKLLPPTEYSGMAFKETLKELNFKWKPHYIYADEGYGHFLIEDLQVESQYALEHREGTDYSNSLVNLGKIIKPINFSSNIKLYNPATGTYFEKYAKNFLIENAVQIFEREKINFAESDKTLIKQLGNYIEVKKQDNGKIIYGMENEGIGDHRLDAFCLSMAGLVIEESLYSTNTYRGSETFLKQKQDEKENFISAIEEATKIKNLFLKNKIPGNFNITAIARGSTKQQEYESWKQRMWEEGKSSHTNRRSDIIINPEKEQKGFFSKKGLAEFVETRPGEDKEENWKYAPSSSPVKARRNTNRNRSNIFNK